jgi:hypothetical protein
MAWRRWPPAEPGRSVHRTDAPGIADWDSLDRLDAYELNCLSDVSKNMVAFFDEPTSIFGGGFFSALWFFPSHSPPGGYSARIKGRFTI